MSDATLQHLFGHLEPPWPSLVVFGGDASVALRFDLDVAEIRASGTTQCLTGETLTLFAVLVRARHLADTGARDDAVVRWGSPDLQDLFPGRTRQEIQTGALKYLRQKLSGQGIANGVRTLPRIGLSLGDGATLRLEPARRSAAPATDCFTLEDGRPIQLQNLYSALRCGQQRETPAPVEMAFVFGSGLCHASQRRLGLVCDALYTPEIAVTIDKGLPDDEVRIWSGYDVDLLASAGGDLATSLYRPHIVSTGMGDVNEVTRRVLEHYEGRGTPLRPAPVWKPVADVGGEVRHILPERPEDPIVTSVRAGCLVVVRNPFWPDRLFAICAGMHGRGTLGALWLLLQFLSGSQFDEGEASQSPIPCRVFKTVRRDYARGGVGVLEPDSVLPEQDIRNLDDDHPLRFL